MQHSASLLEGISAATGLLFGLIHILLQVQIAACDTFRSGAVEQLRTHCNRLSIPLYERGYEKDPAKVAYEAIKSAERSNIDVLLVDTAGEGVLCQCALQYRTLHDHQVFERSTCLDLSPCDFAVCSSVQRNLVLQVVCKTMSHSCVP